VKHGLWAVWVVVACGRAEPPTPPQSEPVLQEARSTPPAMQVVTLDAEPVPVSQADLAAQWPPIHRLKPSAQEVVTTALNLVPGPCEPCAQDHESLARCALRPPTEACKNVRRLIRRATRMAQRGDGIEAVREAVHYPDNWLLYTPDTGEMVGPPSAGVRVDLWRDASSLWSRVADTTVARLVDRYPGAVRVHIHDLKSPSGLAIGARTTPTWAVAGYRMRGAQSPDALGRLIEREIAHPPKELKP